MRTSEHWHAKPTYLLLALAIMAASGCSPPSAAGSAHASGAPAPSASASATWPNHGATACAQYLTPQFLGSVITSTTGTTESLMPQGCTFTASDGGTVSILLTGGGAAAFHARQQFLDNPQPVSGIGDGAVMSTDGLSSYQGNYRTCDVHIAGPSGFKKLDGQALATQLGTICNALYAQQS